MFISPFISGQTLDIKPGLFCFVWGKVERERSTCARACERKRYKGISKVILVIDPGLSVGKG